MSAFKSNNHPKEFYNNLPRPEHYYNYELKGVVIH